MSTHYVKKSVVVMFIGFFIFIFSLFGKLYGIISLDITRVLVGIGLISFSIGGYITVVDLMFSCISENSSENNNQPGGPYQRLVDLCYW